MQWFRSLGLLSAAEESGRVYPVTNTAASVLDVLRLALEARGAVFCCGQEIKSAQKKGNKFVLTDGTGQKIEADRLIIACGGPAGARVGGTDSGSRLLSSFGHAGKGGIQLQGLLDLRDQRANDAHRSAHAETEQHQAENPRGFLIVLHLCTFPAFTGALCSDLRGSENS